MDEIEIVASRALRRIGGEPARDGTLRRVRHGLYAQADELEAATVEARYRARILALAAVRPNAVFALESALAIHGLPFGAEPAYVFTTGDANTPGARAGVRHPHLPIPDRHVVTFGAVRASSLAWTLADVARRRLPSDSVPPIDAALRSGRVVKSEVSEALVRQSRANRRRAGWSLAFADERSESVGESRSRVAMSLLGFPAPELQVEVATAEGVLRSDFGWRLDGRLLLGEFDGMVKYGAIAAANGRTGAQALAMEKAREDRLRRHADVVRWVWADVMRPERLERLLGDRGLSQRDRVRPPGVRLPG